jgi:hypothetical protein
VLLIIDGVPVDSSFVLLVIYSVPIDSVIVSYLFLWNITRTKSLE